MKYLRSSSSLLITAVLFIVVLHSGCVTQHTGTQSGTLRDTDKQQNGQMSSSERGAIVKDLKAGSSNVVVDEEMLTNLKKISNADAQQVCDHYCAKDNFAKCTTCLDTFFEREDVTTVVGRSCQASTSIPKESIAADFTDIMDYYQQRARIHLFFSEYEEAQKNLDVYGELVDKLEQCSTEPVAEHYINTAELYAIIGGQAGRGVENQSRSQAYLEAADEIALNSDERESKVISEVNKARIIVHIANREYEHALEILNDPADYLNKNYADRLAENLQERKELIDNSVGAIGLVGNAFGVDRQKTAMAQDLTETAIVAATMLEEAVAGLQDLPYRNFQIAKCNYELGNFEEAKVKYQQLLGGSFDKGGNYNIEAVYQDLGHIYYSQKNYEKSIKYLKEAITLIERYRSTLNTDVDKMGFITSNRQQTYAMLIETLVKTNRNAEALEFVERAKSRVLVDMLAGKKSFGQKSEREVMRRYLEHKQYAEEETAKRERGELVSAGSSGTRAVGKRQKEAGARDVPVTPDDEATISAKFSSLVSVQGLTHAQIQSYLAEDETILEFFGEEPNMLAFVVTSQDVWAVQIDATNLKGKVDSFRNDIITSKDSGTGTTVPTPYLLSGSSLYQQLIIPVRDLLKTEKLTIIPHGSLHHLPFNALYDAAIGKYLVEDFSIRTLPSASVLQFLKNRPERNRDIFVLSDPYTEDHPEFELDPLPWTKIEGEVIQRNYPATIHLNKRAATETTLRDYGSIPSILHIAAHGYFDEEEAMKSRIFLAPDDIHNGDLTVEELYDLELNNYLVTLSACETGLGELKNGDDVVGLIRGFLFAGTESLVTTLWKVADDVTSTLMVDFYKNLDSWAKQDALRAAQLKQLKEGAAHPYFWAPFQLTGASGLAPGKTQYVDFLAADTSAQRREMYAEYRALEATSQGISAPSASTDRVKLASSFSGSSGARGVTKKRKIAAPTSVGATPQRPLPRPVQVASVQPPKSSGTRAVGKRKKSGVPPGSTGPIMQQQQPRHVQVASLQPVTSLGIGAVGKQKTSTVTRVSPGVQRKETALSRPSQSSPQEQTRRPLVQQPRQPENYQRQAQSVVASGIEIFTNMKRKSDSRFLTTSEQIPIALYVGKRSSHKFLTLIISDKSRGERLYEIPILVDKQAEYIVASLKRPMQGWVYGSYEIHAVDSSKQVVSKKEFTIVE